MLHFSTDYVLDGSEPGRKDEGAAPGPVNQYGWSKLDGERRVQEMCPSAMICRVSWIFGTDPPGFLGTVLNLAKAGKDLEFVADKWSTPSSVEDIARATEFLLGEPDLSGVIHLTNPGEGESWWSYGEKVIGMALDEGLLERRVEVRPTKLADIPQLSAPRPIHTALAPRRLLDELGWSVRRWEEAAREQIRAMGRAGESH